MNRLFTAPMSSVNRSKKQSNRDNWEAEIVDSLVLSLNWWPDHCACHEMFWDNIVVCWHNYEVCSNSSTNWHSGKKISSQSIILVESKLFLLFRVCCGYDVSKIYDKTRSSAIAGRPCDAKACQGLLKWAWKWQSRLKWPSNVLQGHQKWHQSKASVWLRISCL